MAMDAGAIRTEAELDLAQFQRAMATLQGNITTINRAMEGIKPAQPRLDTAPLQKDVTSTRAALGVLVSDLGGLPGVSGQASAQLLGVGNAASGLSVGATAGAAALATVVAGMTAAAKAASDLEFQIAAVKSIKLTLDTREATESIRALSAQTGQSVDSLTKGLYNIFSSLNVSQAQAVKLLEGFAKGAVAAQTDTQTFGTAVAGVLNAYKLSVDDATKVSDIFFNTVRDGVVTGAQLAAGLGPVTASAKAAGVSLEELGALLVGVTKEGGDAAQNINNLNNLLAKLVTKETTKAFQDLGIAVADASGKLRSPIEILTDLRARLNGMTEAARAAALQEIFPDLQARQGAQVLISQLDTVKSALEVNRTEAGATQAAYQTMADTSKAAMDRLGQSVARLAGQFGDTLLPAVIAVTLKAGDAVNAFSDMGTAIDKFLSDPQTRAAAELILRLQQGITGPAAPAGADQVAPNAAVTGAQIALADKLRSEGRSTPTPAEVQVIKDLAMRTLELANADRELTQQTTSLAAASKALDQDSRELASHFKSQSETAQLAATQTEKLRLGLAAGAGASIDYAAAIAKALDPTVTVAAAQGPLIEGILKSKQATEELNQVYQLQDKALATQIIQYRALADAAKDPINALALQATALDLLNRGLADEKAQLDAATAAQRAADQAAKQLADTMARAAAVAENEYSKRLQALATSVLPALDAATNTSLQQAIIWGEKQQALGIIAAATGKSTEELNAAITGTGVAAAQAAQEAAALAKGFESFATDELKSRFESATNALAAGLDAATAAQVKFLQETGRTEEALDVVLRQFNLAPAAIDALKQGLAAGGAEAAAARIKLAELGQSLEYVRANGNIQLKVDVQITEVRKQIHEAQQAFQQANTDRAHAQAQADRAQAKSMDDLTKAYRANERQHVDTLLNIDKAWNENTRKFGQALQSAASQANEAFQNLPLLIDPGKTITALEDELGKLGKRLATGEISLGQSVAAANAIKDLIDTKTTMRTTLEDAVRDATKSHADALKSINDGLRDAIEAATDAARAALSQLASALDQFNAQQRAQAATTSIAVQNAQLQRAGIDPNAAPTGGTFGARSLAQIQAEGQAALAQQAAERQLNQQRNAAAIAANKASEQAADAQQDAAKQTKDANEALTKALRAAGKQFADAQYQLQRTFEKQRDANTLARAEIEKSHQKARDAAEAAADAEYSRLKQAAREEEARYEKTIRELNERKSEMLEEFERQQQQRVRQQREAEKAYAQTMRELRERLAGLEELKGLNKSVQEMPDAIAERLNLAPQTFQFEKVVAQETGVDWLRVTPGKLLDRVRSGV